MTRPHYGNPGERVFFARSKSSSGWCTSGVAATDCQLKPCGQWWGPRARGAIIRAIIKAIMGYLCDQLSLCENWPLENKVPMRSPYAFYPGVALR